MNGASSVNGGATNINAGACHAGFGLGSIATPATHGTGSVVPLGRNQQINYAYNGTSGPHLGPPNRQGLPQPNGC
jgi:hypothetical protein